MDKSGANAFVYAKASGLLRKAFINDRVSSLFEVNKLTDLWTLLFSSQPPAVPEVYLAQRIEEEAFNQFKNQYIRLLQQYDSPDSILLENLYAYEIENLKELSEALCNKEQKCPELIDLGDFALFDYSKWPVLKKITENTNYSWFNSIPQAHNQQEFELKIDIQYVHELWKSIGKTSLEARNALYDFYKEKYIIKNTIWALRLKKFYKLENEEIIKKLIFVTEQPDKKDPIAAPVLQILEKSLENYEDWKNWQYKDLLNPYIKGEIWEIDPSWIERKSVIRINEKSSKLFHNFGMTSASLIGWFYLKDYELCCIRAAVEGLRLNINHNEVKNAVGIAE